MTSSNNIQVRTDLMAHIRRYIEVEGLTQHQAAERFGVPQPRISEIVQGKVELFTVDKLINLLASVGHQVELSFKSNSTK